MYWSRIRRYQVCVFRSTYPSTLSETVKTKLVGDLGGIHSVLHPVSLTCRICRLAVPTYRKILFVGKHQQKGITKLVLVQHALQFLTGFDDTISVVGVNNEDDALGVLEIMSPKRSDLVLSTDIPHGELNVLVLNSLDVEACQKVRCQSIEDVSQCAHTDGGDRSAKSRSAISPHTEAFHKIRTRSHPT